MKQLPKENIYSNIKGPIDLIKNNKSNVLTPDLNTQIKNFQKEPNTSFMNSLQSRVPTNTKFHIQNPTDFGLNRDRVVTGKFGLENSGVTSSLLNKRMPNNGVFKQSKGIPSLDNYFNKLIPKDLDYRYIDPQTYEYKLKGMTQEKMIKNKMLEEGLDKPLANLDPNDPAYYNKKAQLMQEQKALEETLHPTAQYKRWREQALADKATKIQRAFRGYNDRAVLDEVEQNYESTKPRTISDAIEVGRANRRQKTEIYKQGEEERKQFEESEKINTKRIADEGKFEKYRLEHPNLDQKQALC